MANLDGRTLRREPQTENLIKEALGGRRCSGAGRKGYILRRRHPSKRSGPWL